MNASYLHFFEEISRIPRGSGNTRAISDYCAAFARDRGLRWIREPCHNVLIFKDATAGYETHPAVMIQGHLDMVCEKDPDCPIHMDRDGLRLKRTGEWLFAEGSTLGADDGIAVAYALALLDSDRIPHPPLEVVLTVDEETGMDGARLIDPAPLKARTLLNIDSEAEGILTVGCAGGCRAEVRWNAARSAVSGAAWRIAVGGLRGGHSGMDIDKGRANADILLARILAEFRSLRLIRLSGGAKDNAIPRTAEAIIAVDEAVPEIAARMAAGFRAEFGTAEPDLTVIAEPVAADAAFSEADSARVVDMLATQPNGIQSMCPQIPGLVQTSLNLGTLKSDFSGVTATMSLRSSVNAEKAELKNRLAAMAAAHGAQISFHGEYPAWEYRPDSPIRELMCRCYRELNGAEPSVETIHAGLECGLLGAKLPGLDAVSFGPDILDIHTTRERLNLPSAERTWQLICRVLAAL